MGDYRQIHEMQITNKGEHGRVMRLVMNNAQQKELAENYFPAVPQNKIQYRPITSGVLVDNSLNDAVIPTTKAAPTVAGKYKQYVTSPLGLRKTSASGYWSSFRHADEDSISMFDVDDREYYDHPDCDAFTMKLDDDPEVFYSELLTKLTGTDKDYDIEISESAYK
jgi:hypothetical protein